MPLYAIHIENTDVEDKEFYPPGQEMRQWVRFRQARSAFEALEEMGLNREKRENVTVTVYTLAEEGQMFEPTWKLVE